VRNVETETYSPESSDLSVGCNSPLGRIPKRSAATGTPDSETCSEDVLSPSVSVEDKLDEDCDSDDAITAHKLSYAEWQWRFRFPRRARTRRGQAFY
jgi:hypothetical protein